MNRFYKVETTNFSRENTNRLKENLEHCIGKDTVQVFYVEVSDINTGEIYDGFLVKHYGATICMWIKDLDLMVMNYLYFRYSSSTSRVRNAFCKFITGNLSVPNTEELKQIEEYGAFKECNTTYIVSDIVW